MNIDKASQLQKKYEDFKTRLSKIETIKDMKVKESIAIVNKYNFKDLSDWKNVVALRDETKPKVEAFLDQVDKYITESEPALREVEDSI